MVVVDGGDLGPACGDDGDACDGLEIAEGA